MLLLEGLPRNQYLTNTGFHKKYPIKGQIFLYNLITTISTLLQRPCNTGSGVDASHWVSPKPSFTLRRFIFCSGVGAVCVTSPEPSFALFTEFVDGFLSTLCLQMCGLLLFVKMALLHVLS